MVYVATRAGKRHEKSEDAVLVGTEVLINTSDALPMPDCGFVCVADGVGGNAGGAQASSFVLEELASAQIPTVEGLRQLLISINQALIDSSMNDPVASKKATTLTGVLLDEGSYRLVHVGNTRAYAKQGGFLKQLTSDHTTFNLLKSSGQMAAAESCNKNEITNCFGGGNPSLLSRIAISDIPAFPLLLLTSDGVHEYVGIDTLEDTLNGDSSFSEKCETIIEKAVDAGSDDDMTVVIISPLDS